MGGPPNLSGVGRTNDPPGESLGAILGPDLEPAITPDDVHAWLTQHRDERGIVNFKQRNADSPLTSVGIGLTRLRKFARSVGRDHELSQALWASDVYEARALALLVDDPKRITREQAETQVEQLHGGYLAHVFSSCDASLGRVPFVVELAADWMVSDDLVRRRCGYGLLYELSKSKKKSAPGEAWFSQWVAHIDAARGSSDVDTLLSMGNALVGIGRRSVALNTQALAVARAIGPIDFDPDGTCDPFDPVKHLDSEYIRAKLGISGSRA